ncbi:MAG: hypothetical protein H6715_00625, partial [Myxococcales bacterium]|nr:hypothetical protein [Myxococcales bacterium]
MMRSVIATLLVVMGCGSTDKGAPPLTRSKQLMGVSSALQGAKINRCDGKAAGDEVSEYDTSGDQVPDVRKVFRRVGDDDEMRLVMVCRESDLNADGVKDVIRHYNDDGRPVREETDRDFDGRIDSITYFDGGQIVQQELDSTGNGRVDTRIFLENGAPLRAERDLKGRSTASTWKPDRWEYYEKSRIVRMGTDVDGDGIV